MIDIIHCDETSYLVWKWHPIGTVAGQNHRENEIQWGSSIHVKDGQVAVLAYRKDNGSYQDYLPGPFDGLLETANLSTLYSLYLLVEQERYGYSEAPVSYPLLSNMLKEAYGGRSPYQTEVYFVNLAHDLKIRFAVPFFDVFDSRYPHLGIPVAVRGSAMFGIDDYENFLHVHGLRSITIQQFQNSVRDSIQKIVKSALLSILDECDYPVIQIERTIPKVSEHAFDRCKVILKDRQCVQLTDFDISTIEIDRTNRNYHELVALYRNSI